MLSQKPWRAEAVIQLIAGVFVCLGAGVVTAGLLRSAGVPAFKSPDSPANILLATLSFQGVTWLLIFNFLKQHKVNWRDAFGLRNTNLDKSVLLAVVVLALVLPIVLQLEQYSVQVLQKIGWPLEDERAVALIVNAKSAWLQIYLAFFAIVLAPVAEEFMFRGVLFPFVKQLGFPKLAWFGVSFLFALIHVNAPTLVPLFVFAVVLTWLYQKTDCLLAPIAAHSLFNTANLVILYTQQR
ncbi:MAG TPA: CPBP family intramembrane glutamic endopeptidase [Verrucomicrobiae bacterium]